MADQMGNRNNEGGKIVNPRRRTLGDYATQQGPTYFSSIAMPATTRSLELKASILNLISYHQFTGMNHDDPYTHLSIFYELICSMGFVERDMESIYLHIYFFSQ